MDGNAQSSEEEWVSGIIMALFAVPALIFLGILKYRAAYHRKMPKWQRFEGSLRPDRFAEIDNFVYNRRRYTFVRKGLYQSVIQDGDQNVVYYPTVDLYALVPPGIDFEIYTISLDGNDSEVYPIISQIRTNGSESSRPFQQYTKEHHATTIQQIAPNLVVLLQSKPYATATDAQYEKYAKPSAPQPSCTLARTDAVLAQAFRKHLNPSSTQKPTLRCFRSGLGHVRSTSEINFSINACPGRRFVHWVIKVARTRNTISANEVQTFPVPRMKGALTASRSHTHNTCTLGSRPAIWTTVPRHAIVHTLRALITRSYSGHTLVKPETINRSVEDLGY
ncbi:hypothetical protein PSACC_03510 [Paramicrosporidium saccamoebae]|uniref:Uncharacterized protein n=1 Tax=Paramicrosporidium saccamoebae TaxID=1246581 RepID=A0A2H9TG16_9FUNG|nr:hypothetical protein PSACC_03510 [Paramicrosporidium saccamoebae]